MKVIFLDIDGVLVTHETVCQHVTFEGRRYNPFLPEAVANLNFILEQTGAEIVVSSSWRCDGQMWDDLLFYFSDQGINKRPIDRTPDLPVLSKGGEFIHPNRGQEIKLYLDSNAGVEGFVAIDDDSDMDPIRDNFVHVLGGMRNRGLQRSHAVLAIEILRRGL